MYHSLIVCLVTISWCRGAIVPSKEEPSLEQAKQTEEANQRIFAASQIGNQQLQTYAPARASQLSTGQYFYPSYLEYENGGYAVKPGYENYLVPAAVSSQRESTWATDVATSLLPFSSEILVYGMRAGAYLLHFLFATLLGGAVTTVLCTLTPLCSISFLGINKHQVQEQVAELARTFVTPETINAATVLVSRAIDKYATMQREEDENLKRKTIEKSSVHVSSVA